MSLNEDTQQSRESVKMTPELKAKWITALRSGKWRQVTGSLHCRKTDYDCGGYCCLGVLCSVATGVENAYSAGGYTLLDAFVSSEQQNKLVTLNDDRKKSFPEIADWIEANVPTVETPNTPEVS